MTYRRRMPARMGPCGIVTRTARDEDDPRVRVRACHTHAKRRVHPRKLEKGGPQPFKFSWSDFLVIYDPGADR